MFVQKLEMVFSFNDVEALDSGLVFYVFYISLLGIFWDPLPPKRYDLGLAMNLRPIGACSGRCTSDGLQGLFSALRMRHDPVQAAAGSSTLSCRRSAGAARCSQVRSLRLLRTYGCMQQDH